MDRLCIEILLLESRAGSKVLRLQPLEKTSEVHCLEKIHVEREQTRRRTHWPEHVPSNGFNLFVNSFFMHRHRRWIHIKWWINKENIACISVYISLSKSKRIVGSPWTFPILPIDFFSVLIFVVRLVPSFVVKLY
jgi:hypothetical protein